MAMANTKPVTDSPELVRLVVEKAAPTGVTVLPVGAVTKGLGGAELTDFAALKQAGAPALSDDGVPIQDEKLLRQAMEAAKAVGPAPPRPLRRQGSGTKLRRQRRAGGREAGPARPTRHCGGDAGGTGCAPGGGDRRPYSHLPYLHGQERGHRPPGQGPRGDRHL